MRVTSREYKVIVDGSLFADVEVGLSDILDDLGDLGRSVGVEVSGKFDDKDPNERSILFLDTPDYTLHENGLLLRQRVKRKSGKTEYTLKCRTEDRYIAEGKDLSSVAGLKPDSKFEEDIGVPFVSRFSHSTTVELDEDDDLAGKKFPKTLLAAGTGSFPGFVPCTATAYLARRPPRWHRSTACKSLNESSRDRRFTFPKDATVARPRQARSR